MNYNEKVFERQYPVIVFFVQHLAYYRGLRANYNTTTNNQEFWRATCDAHLKLATVAWCNVFGTYREDIHWTKTSIPRVAVQARKKFRELVLAHTGLTRKQWKTYHQKLLTFRNKYVAHLDPHHPFNKPVPFFDAALQVACAYQEWAIDLIRPVALNQPTLISLYEKWEAEARSVMACPRS
jgi:hypothetical protein